MVDSLGDVADEDTWMKLNKGFVADLDKIQFTPTVKCQPTPLTTATTVSRYIYFTPVIYQYWIICAWKLTESHWIETLDAYMIKSTLYRLFF